MTGGVKNAKKESKIHEAVRANYSDLLDGLKALLPRLFSIFPCFARQHAFVVANFFHQKFRFSIRLLLAAPDPAPRSPFPVPHSAPAPVPTWIPLQLQLGESATSALRQCTRLPSTKVWLKWLPTARFSHPPDFPALFGGRCRGSGVN